MQKKPEKPVPRGVLLLLLFSPVKLQSTYGRNWQKAGFGALAHQNLPMHPSKTSAVQAAGLEEKPRAS